MNQPMCSENITSLAKAMLKVHSKLNPVTKDKVNTFKGSNYASFAAVMEGCRESLLSAGIWLIQYPVEVQSEMPMLALVTKLVHAESGEWQSSLLTIPVSKDDPQAFGSALTYARRYGLCALVGIVTEDDDGYVATAGTQTPQKQKVSTVVHNGANSGVPRSQNPVSSGQNDQGNSQVMDFPEMQTLPKLDGISYQKFQGSDGQFYITVTGNTRSKNEILKSAGFRWSPDRNTWWKQAS